MFSSVRSRERAAVCQSVIHILYILAVLSVGTRLAYGQRQSLPMDGLSSAPIVAEFLPKYERMMTDRKYAVATSEAAVLLAKHPQNKDVQIAATYCWALATLARYERGPISERKSASVSAAQGLERCLALIKEAPSVERREKYATLQRDIPIYLAHSACLAGSHTLVVEMVEGFFAKDPDNESCVPATAILCGSFELAGDIDGLIRSLKGLVEHYKGRWAAFFVLLELGRIYDRRGDNAGFRSVVETMEADFPDDNIYKQALRRLIAERKTRTAPNPGKKQTPSAGTGRQALLATACGCGCGASTATATTPAARSPVASAGAATRPAPGVAARAAPLPVAPAAQSNTESCGCGCGGSTATATIPIMARTQPNAAPGGAPAVADKVTATTANPKADERAELLRVIAAARAANPKLAVQPAVVRQSVPANAAAQAEACGCGCGSTTTPATTRIAAPSAKLVPSAQAIPRTPPSPSTAAGSCCTTGCATTVATAMK